ncbi:MAG: hypothetical protein DWI23_02365 [Planctomycetota bacterium]|jgi:hypothetical protein|nr:MAG: hypothetical protein DWI23_02365 [Planctomycetota bacterium]
MDPFVGLPSEQRLTTTMQNAIAITIAIAAAMWLARSLSKRLFAPPCQQPSSGGPEGTDGFIPLHQLRGCAPTASKPKA